MRRLFGSTSSQHARWPLAASGVSPLLKRISLGPSLFAAALLLGVGCSEEQQLRNEQEDVREQQQAVEDAKQEAREDVAEEQQQLEEEKQDVREEAHDDAHSDTDLDSTTTPNSTLP